VPSCVTCNRGFSLDEQYFWVLLGQISPSPTMAGKVASGGAIDRTLERSPLLDERLIRMIEPDEDGARVLIKPEIERVHRVISKLAIGLFFLRYGGAPPADLVHVVGAYPYTMDDLRPEPVFISTFTQRFRHKRWHHVQRQVFSYIFVRHPKHSGKLWCVMDFHETLWGVAEMPNPKSRRVGNRGQLPLFPSARAA
jgi:hypothetical protein